MKCDVHGCGKDAVVNFQKTWVEYPVDKDGNYGEMIHRGCDIEEPTGEDNRHYCERHKKEFEEGDI